MVESFTVCVGKEAKQFVVIQSIATRSSKFFQAAISRDWKEAREKRVMLPETEIEVFEGYLQWLYTSHITITDWKQDYFQMANLYVLGDFLDDVTFRNAILKTAMSTFLEKFQLPNAQVVRVAWERTPTNSLLRQSFSEMWSLAGFKYSINYLLKSGPEITRFPTEFVREHLERFMLAHKLDDIRGTEQSKTQVMANLKKRILCDTTDAEKS